MSRTSEYGSPFKSTNSGYDEGKDKENNKRLGKKLSLWRFNLGIHFFAFAFFDACLLLKHETATLIFQTDTYICAENNCLNN